MHTRTPLTLASILFGFITWKEIYEQREEQTDGAFVIAEPHSVQVVDRGNGNIQS